MITFIGGFSCTGKTKLALRLMKETGVPYFSMDYLKMGIYRSDANCGFTPVDKDAHIADKLWPIIREMAYTYIENGQDMIIEGCYILPEHATDITEKYKHDVNFIFIGFSESYIVENFESGILGYKGTVEKRNCEDERPTSIFIDGHAELRRSAMAMNQPFYMIEENYEDEFEGIYTKVNRLVRK